MKGLALCLAVGIATEIAYNAFKRATGIDQRFVVKRMINCMEARANLTSTSKK